ncbi:MAG: hypothetical protein ACYC4U_26645 [Pirellulaceae bacterium]
MKNNRYTLKSGIRPSQEFPKMKRNFGDPCQPIAVNRHFILSHYPDYLVPTQFVHLFRNLWSGLPLAARRPITAYWRSVGGTLAIVEELDNSLTATHATPIAGIAYKQHLEFLDACLVLPDHVQQFTIAHELAHLYLLAKQPDSNAYRDEEEVDRIVTEWFNCEDDSDWWSAVGRVWHRYALNMFEDVRSDSLAEICDALSSGPGKD